MWELRKLDVGMGGLFDGSLTIEAHFTTFQKALNWLIQRGYTWEEHGSFYHTDIDRRNTMGQISFQIIKAPSGPPVDPE